MLCMLQPTLYSYSFTGPPEPVLLDVSSIAPGEQPISLLQLGWCLRVLCKRWLEHSLIIVPTHTCSQTPAYAVRRVPSF